MVRTLDNQGGLLLRLKFTTKIYLFLNLLLTLLRTLQILFLTEPGTAFLKDGHAFLNWTGSIIVVLVMLYLAANSYLTLRQPTKVGSIGIPGFVLYALSAALFAIGGAATFVGKPHFWAVVAVSAPLAAFACALFAAGEIAEYEFPRPASLIFIACVLCEMLAAYKFYTEHPLRVRTVFEVFAICGSLLFFVVFGKTLCGVRPERSFRFLYPLGLISSTLCFASVVPETLAGIFGKGANVSASCISQFLLFGAGLFIATVTLATFRRQNTKRPQRPAEQ